MAQTIRTNDYLLNTLLVDGATVNQQSLRDIVVSSVSGMAGATKTTTATLADDDCFVAVDATGGAFTATLPAVASSAGKLLKFLKVDSSANAVTLDGNSTETIADTVYGSALTLTLYAQWDYAELYCDGSRWVVIKRNLRPIYCRMSITANSQSIASGTTGAVVGLDTIAAGDDFAGIGNTSTHIITLPRAGRWRIEGTVSVNGMDAGDQVRVFLQKNGSNIQGGSSPPESLGTGFSDTFASAAQAVTDLCAAGDEIRLYAYHVEGASQTLASAAFAVMEG